MREVPTWKELEIEFRERAGDPNSTYGVFYPSSSQSAATYLFGSSLFSDFTPFLTNCITQKRVTCQHPPWRYWLDLQPRDRVAEEAFKCLARLAAKKLPGCPCGLDSPWQYWISLLHLKSPYSRIHFRELNCPDQFSLLTDERTT